MLIRKADINDLKQLSKLQINMAWESEKVELSEDVVTAGIKAAIEDPDVKGQIWVAVDKTAEVVGTLMITYEWSDWRNGWIWWIESVYVSLDYRKQGVYKMLYNHIKDIVNANQEIKGIRLYVDKTNISAQNVYDALGMCGDHYTTYEWMK